MISPVKKASPPVAAALLAVALVGFAASPSSAAVTGAGATVTPAFQTGACPFTFNFSGTIQSNTGGEVKFRWIRSDHAIAPVQTLVFRGPGSRNVGGETWTLSPAHVHGWEAIEILAPNRYVSNRATFELNCVGRR